ncbi:hypothetical protein WT83_04795 [Burkholderia territorii]|uniref:Uncharacterized protein n=1 Tax=Burkholderia territorii TaxID=1503055 RepID=A0A108F2U8_9BURK|nr:hypothetical protein WT83_04795 [Burkholderia territorii]
MLRWIHQCAARVECVVNLTAQLHERRPIGAGGCGLYRIRSRAARMRGESGRLWQGILLVIDGHMHDKCM